MAWGFNSREAVILSRLENIEKQSEKFSRNEHKRLPARNEHKRLGRREQRQLETRETRRRAAKRFVLVSSWKENFSLCFSMFSSLDKITASRLQPGKAGNSGAHVGNV